MNDNVPPSLAARLMVRGGLIALVCGFAFQAGMKAAEWLIGG